MEHQFVLHSDKRRGRPDGTAARAVCRKHRKNLFAGGIFNGVVCGSGRACRASVIAASVLCEGKPYPRAPFFQPQAPYSHREGHRRAFAGKRLEEFCVGGQREGQSRYHSWIFAGRKTGGNQGFCKRVSRRRQRCAGIALVPRLPALKHTVYHDTLHGKPRREPAGFPAAGR